MKNYKALMQCNNNTTFFSYTVDGSSFKKVTKEAKEIVRGEHQQSRTNVSFFIVSDGKNDTKFSLYGFNKRFSIEKY
jgi:hypothetical protein